MQAGPNSDVTVVHVSNGRALDPLRRFVLLSGRSFDLGLLLDSEVEWQIVTDENMEQMRSVVK